MIFPLLALAFVPFSHSAPTYSAQATLPTWDWAAGAVTAYPIHPTCNSSETALLRQALAEAVTLAAHARDHILRYGNSSEYFTKYFGAGKSAEPAGWFDKVVNGDKAGVLFRCDDVDRNCATQDGWAGHWRGSNATDETVICPLSYTTKWPLAGLCSYGYTVASHSTTAYFASDLLHRLYHTDKVGEGVVGHYADGYPEVLQLAIDSPEEAVRNSATLRYFALDVYAHDIANPGIGCIGEPVVESESSVAESTTSATLSTMQTSTMAVSSAATSATAVSAVQQSTEASVTTSAATECHTHSDGVVHCA